MIRPWEGACFSAGHFGSLLVPSVLQRGTGGRNKFWSLSYHNCITRNWFTVMPYDLLVIYTSRRMYHCLLCNRRGVERSTACSREIFSSRPSGVVEACHFSWLETVRHDRRRVQQHWATKSTAGSRPLPYQDVTFLGERSRKGKERAREERRLDSRD